MPNKTKTKQKQKQKAQPRQRKPTPFADSGEVIGDAASTFFRMPMLKGIGRWLGSGIGSIFGKGDYTLMGEKPAYNLLMNGNQIPRFETKRNGNIISHREFITNVTGTTNFTNTSYPLNPGLTQTFPWMSPIADSFQEWKPHGIIFEFRSLITDYVTGGAPGTIIMATNYNAVAPLFTTKQEMENSEFAVSVKPTKDLIHGIECAMDQTVLNQLYVRTGSPPTGAYLRMYDLGNFQIATEGNPNQLLGELWVSYTFELLKPVLPSDVGGDVQSAIIGRQSAGKLNPLGTTQYFLSGDLIGLAVTSSSLSWFVQPGNCYQVTITWNGTAFASSVPSLGTLTGLTTTTVYKGRTANVLQAPANGTSTTMLYAQWIFTATAVSPQLGVVRFNLDGDMPGTNVVDITITQWSDVAV